MNRALAAKRRASVPPITYPDDLPIAARRDEIIELIRDHQVVVIAGETGSGKSTQLPKMCLELGRGVEGRIGHTQPRRLAARSIAERVATELGTTIGGLVGYTVRFTDEVKAHTLIKVMTDGILLAELQRDPDLSNYDTLIIDEAHERTLNIDFLLGYLRRLIDRRRDLKIIITSATIDTERFSAHFDNAPIIEVTGRTYPVDVRYRPLGGPDQASVDINDAIAETATALLKEVPGDVLVFLSGEREIRDAQDRLAKLHRDNLEVLPLYARLSPAEQQRVFQAHQTQRIILSTNVAETSLTVPGIRTVIDVGTARISRFNRRTKVQRLPIEAISQASADQRAGRCGRLGPGICVRLFDEDDYLNRPEFTEPEVQRTNLASVVLRMASLGLGDPATFPFVDPPENRAIRDGIRLLEELDAVIPEHEGTPDWLTALGGQLAALPVDPRLGRMLLEADDHGCVTEVLIIVAGLSVQDPKIRPAGVGSGAAQERAAELHRRYADPRSDFVSWLLLWEHIKKERRDRSGNGFRRMCRDEYLHFLRIREWEDVHRQLRQIAKDLGLRLNDNPADPDAVHQALLSGLLSHVGFYDTEQQNYRGARNARFVVGSGAKRRDRNPAWVMVAELVETNVLRGRGVAPINPQWLERSASHLLQWEYSDPWWSEPRGAAMCHERASLYGLPVVANRSINLHRVDPVAARQLFIRHALVMGEWSGDHAFITHNQSRLDEITDLENRLRRDLQAPDEHLEAAYDRKVPDSIVSTRHFEKWWKQTKRKTPDLLNLSLNDLVDQDQLSEIRDSPRQWPLGDQELPLSYLYDPSDDVDGITVDISLNDISRIDHHQFEWLVPSRRHELVTELLRALPKRLRRSLVPVPTTVTELLAIVDPSRPEPLRQQLCDELTARLGEPVRLSDFATATLPTHLVMHFRIVDQGESLAEDDDLELLKRHLHDQARRVLAEAGHPLEHPGADYWDFGDLPTVVEAEGLGQVVKSFPALVDHGDSVGVELVATAAEQHEKSWAGVRRLLSIERPSLAKVLRPLLTDEVKFAILASPYHTAAAWFEDCVAAALDQIMHDHGGPVFTAAGYARLRKLSREHLAATVAEVAEHAAAVLATADQLRRSLDAVAAPALAESVADIDRQLQQLVYDGFIAGVGLVRLPDIDRYLRAASWRLNRLPDVVARDRDRMKQVQMLEQQHGLLVDRLDLTPELETISWDLQELRVSQFAQSIGVRGSVSVKRIRTALDALNSAL